MRKIRNKRLTCVKCCSENGVRGYNFPNGTRNLCSICANNEKNMWRKILEENPNDENANLALRILGGMYFG